MKDTSQLHVQRGTMIKVMSSPCGVRTQHVHGWVFIIWFTLAVSVPVNADVELETIPEVVARCGENVTLTCNTSVPHQEITYFAWLVKNKTYEAGKSDSGGLCERMDTNNNTRLTLTLLNVMPGSQGTYLCKLRSKKGAPSNKTLVRVQDCLGISESSINKSQAKCWFNGVYPSGVIHWFQGNVNLTDSGSTQEQEDQDGRYNVSSTIDVQRGNQSLPFECRLWIPSDLKYLDSRELPVTDKVISSGRVVRMEWILLTVEIMMVKLMT